LESHFSWFWAIKSFLGWRKTSFHTTGWGKGLKRVNPLKVVHWGMKEFFPIRVKGKEGFLRAPFVGF